jgi:hypothetical protein
MVAISNPAYQGRFLRGLRLVCDRLATIRAPKRDESTLDKPMFKGISNRSGTSKLRHGGHYTERTHELSDEEAAGLGLGLYRLDVR